MKIVTDILTLDFDHAYRVISTDVESLPSDIAALNKATDGASLPWETVSWSEEFQTYSEYAGDEYLDGDEEAVLARVFDGE